jgi:hypothetical protein
VVGGDLATQWEFTIKLFTARTLEDNIDELPPGDGPRSPPTQDALELELGTSPPEPQMVPEFAIPIDDDTDMFDVFHGESLVRYECIADFIGDEPMPGQTR